MIAYFPEIYPDELLYSLLARFYTKSGYPCYWYAAEDLFISKTVRPDIEFVNQYTPTAMQMITKDMSKADMILNHTMFPYYGRFLSLERREKAYESLVNMQGNYHNLLPMVKRKTDSKRYLRYCPMCAEADREKYGESYWHRVHQMQGIDICPLHKCYLMDSDVIISGKTSPTLVAAETVIPEIINSPLICDNEIECKIAQYMADIFQSELDLQGDITVGEFLHSKMTNTKYRSIRGEQRNITLFHTDFMDYYKNLPDNTFTQLWQIQKVLNGYRCNFNEICMLTMFLNIPVADLINMKLPEKTQEQRFDEEIFRLHEQGLKYPEIAKRLNASINVVKPIGEKRYGTEHKKMKNPLKSGAKAYAWQQIDKDTLPFVKEAIRQLQGDEISRPKKVTVFAVEKMLNLPSKRISLYLPMCKAEIEKYEESQEQYWAREVVWAVNKIIREGDVLNWKHIRNLTNMRKCDLTACIPYLNMFVDDKLVNQIKGLL